SLTGRTLLSTAEYAAHHPGGFPAPLRELCGSCLFIPSTSSASARKRRSSSSLGFFSIHATARSYHLRASSFLSICQRAMARKNQSKLSPPLRRWIDLFRASMAALKSLPRYWATPSVFQWAPCRGAALTAFQASSMARAGFRSFSSGHVASSQARELQ